MQSDYQGAYCLNTTVDAFAHWLSQHTRHECPLKFPSPYTKGHCILWPVPPPSPRSDQRPLVLEMSLSYVPGGEETTSHSPEEMRAISFKVEPLFPPAPQPIEVVVEFHTYLVLEYFERFMELAQEFWYGQLGWSGLKRANATLDTIRAIKARMGYQSDLNLMAIATPQELDRSLRDFHSTPPGQQWTWETAPTIGKTRHTRLKVHAYGPSCRGDRIWIAQALDVPPLPSDGELGTPFCIVTAAPSPGYSTESDTVLDLNFWPDWNQGPTPQSYPEYLQALLTVFQERGLIEQPPSWLTALKRTESPPPTGGDVDKARVGRPPLADDDWAYQEIKSGRDQAQVFEEWLERIPKNRRTQLVDPRDSFKKAISYREKREKRE